MCLIQQYGMSARLSSKHRAFTRPLPLPLSTYHWTEARPRLQFAGDYAVSDFFYHAVLYTTKQPSILAWTPTSAKLSPLAEDELDPHGSAHYELTGHNDQLVLVIDDEDDVRTVTVEVLQEAQLKTLQAADGPAGIALFREHATQVKLVILDFFMPGMNGEQVLHKLRSIDPRIPVIFFSGFSEQEVMGRIQLRHRVTFLQKPYTINALWEIVQQYL